MRFKFFFLVIGLGLLFGPLAGWSESQPAAVERTRGFTRVMQQGQPSGGVVLNGEQFMSLLGGGNGDAQAEKAFHQMDANGDGLLDFNEMDEGLRGERGKWDTDQNGFIDLAEFKEYYRAHRRENRAAANADLLKQLREQLANQAQVVNNPQGPDNGAILDLPPGLPPWFTQYDFDHDGQIGLYEWKRAGQPLERFLEYDHNGDGFLTPDEVLEGPAKR